MTIENKTNKRLNDLHKINGIGNSIIKYNQRFTEQLKQLAEFLIQHQEKSSFDLSDLIEGI